MKNVLVGFATATMLFVAAGFAYSSTHSNAVTPAQLKALQKRVAKLEKTSSDVVGYMGSCLFNWQAVTSYGNPPNGGYLYMGNQTDSSSVFLTSAVDYTDVNQQPDGYFTATTNADCVSDAKKLARELGLVTLAKGTPGRVLGTRAALGRAGD